MSLLRNMVVKMKFDELISIFEEHLKSSIQTKRGLTVFVKKRARFEGWLKVEVCDALTKCGVKVVPEKNNIDITLDNWLIELKTVVTNYLPDRVPFNSSRNITNEIDSIIGDIKDLQGESKSFKKAILFIVYPISSRNLDLWNHRHLKRISKYIHKDQFFYVRFQFINDIPGMLYFGNIKDD